MSLHGLYYFIGLPCEKDKRSKPFWVSSTITHSGRDWIKIFRTRGSGQPFSGNITRRSKRMRRNVNMPSSFATSFRPFLFSTFATSSRPLFSSSFVATPRPLFSSSFATASRPLFSSCFVATPRLLFSSSFATTSRPLFSSSFAATSRPLFSSSFVTWFRPLLSGEILDGLRRNSWVHTLLCRPGSGEILDSIFCCAGPAPAKFSTPYSAVPARAPAKFLTPYFAVPARLRRNS